MKTERRFEQDVYAVDFDARVIGRLSVDNSEGVVLDRTLFYPTGGGQPHDTGWLGGLKVVDVQERDDVIVHFLEGGVLLKEGDEVQGRIDWARRFDNMQQHTGQHLLSAAFVQVAQANTRGFHLGAEAVTIDLDRADIPWSVAHDVETWANQKVWQNRSIRHTLVVESETEKIPFRRTPKVEGDLRVVEIDGTDWSACCGTHVRATCEVGLIKVLRLENYKGGTRVHFVCGGRALAAFQSGHLGLDGAARLLSAAEEEVVPGVERLLLENKELKRLARDLEARVLENEAAVWVKNAQVQNGVTVIRGLMPLGDMKAMQQLARTLCAEPGRVVVLGVDDGRAEVVVARSADVNLDVRPLLQEACQRLGGRGGGTPALAQGSGERREILAEVLAEVAGKIS